MKKPTPLQLMRYLFGTVSGAIRLAQPSSPGQHRSSAFPCRALPALGSSGQASWVPKGCCCTGTYQRWYLLLGLFPPKWSDMQVHDENKPTFIYLHAGQGRI